MSVTHKYTKIGVLLTAFGLTTYMQTGLLSKGSLALALVSGLFYITVGKKKEKQRRFYN